MYLFLFVSAGDLNDNRNILQSGLVNVGFELFVVDPSLMVTMMMVFMVVMAVVVGMNMMRLMVHLSVEAVMIFNILVNMQL